MDESETPLLRKLSQVTKIGYVPTVAVIMALVYRGTEKATPAYRDGLYALGSLLLLFTISMLITFGHDISKLTYMYEGAKQVAWLCLILVLGLTSYVGYYIFKVYPQNIKKKIPSIEQKLIQWSLPLLLVFMLFLQLLTNDDDAENEASA